MTTVEPYEIPVAHIDNPESIDSLVQSLKNLHGCEFEFAVQSWQGPTVLSAPTGKTAYRFVMQSTNASIQLAPDDHVHGLSHAGPYHIQNNSWGITLQSHTEALWPGDTIVTNNSIGSAHITGAGTYYEVIAETTDYPLPKLALLRNLTNKPGGCASYPNAFRREVLPPQKPSEHEMDRMGTNRVNQHTLDMRPDRQPLPSKHHHGQVQGSHGMVNHTETALVLPRSVYGLPETNGTTEGHAIIYRDPLNKGTSDSFTIPIKPGSIVVTPSTGDRIYGHCFQNAFAMLVAVPGFVAPYVLIKE